jgi:hypothetical protein
LLRLSPSAMATISCPKRKKGLHLSPITVHLTQPGAG